MRALVIILIACTSFLVKQGEKMATMPEWFQKYTVSKYNNEKILRQYRGEVYAGTWSLYTFYMSSTTSDWNIVVWTPEGLTGNAPLFIFWPGAGENGTDTSDLLNANSPFYHIKQNAITGTILGKQCRFAAIQSQGNIHSASNLAGIMDYTISVAQADTNQIHLTGLSRGGSQNMTILSSASANSKYWRTTTVATLSIGTNNDPSETAHLAWFGLGGRSYSTMGTADTLTYGFAPKWLRIYQPVFPGQLNHHWIVGGGHSGWQLEYNPTTQRWNGMNIYENQMTNSKSPYAAIGNGSSVNLSAGTTSITLNGISRQYPTGHNGWGATTTWSKITGGSVSFSSTSTDTTTASGLSAGTYVFRYTRANAAGGQSAIADITVTVAGESSSAARRMRVRKF